MKNIQKIKWAANEFLITAAGNPTTKKAQKAQSELLNYIKKLDQ